MTSRRARAAAAKAAPVEAGVAPTEMHTDQHPTDEAPAPELAAPESPTPPLDAPGDEPTQLPVAKAAKPFQASLTGQEMAEVNIRVKAVDEARTKANASRDAAVLDDRLANYAQEALSGYISRLITSHDLDEAFIYRVDTERGEIIPSRQRGAA